MTVDANYVYWSTFRALQGDGTIWRANHDGTGANVIATWESGPAGVAVDGGFIYWADYDNGTIWRAGLDGGNPKLIATGQVKSRASQTISPGRHHSLGNSAVPSGPSACPTIWPPSQAWANTWCGAPSGRAARQTNSNRNPCGAGRATAESS